jgi:hypothetical protein
MTEIQRRRPSRWHAFLNRLRERLRRPGVLMKVISLARLLWYLYDKLFGNDPWTFYLAGEGVPDAA